MPVDRKTRFNAGYVVIALLGIMLFNQWWMASRAVATIPMAKRSGRLGHRAQFTGSATSGMR